VSGKFLYQPHPQQFLAPLHFWLDKPPGDVYVKAP
jgi:hypothetical protein